MDRQALLDTKPKRENFPDDESFEEALGYYMSHQGRILAMTVPQVKHAPRAPKERELPLKALQQGLAQAYQARLIADKECLVCKTKGQPLALHVMEFYCAYTHVPKSLIPMSHSRGITRGAAPVCTTCCPPCRECALPIVTPWVRGVLKKLQSRKEETGFAFVEGNGYCRHFHPLHIAVSIFKKPWPYGFMDDEI